VPKFASLLLTGHTNPLRLNQVYLLHQLAAVVNIPNEYTRAATGDEQILRIQAHGGRRLVAHTRVINTTRRDQILVKTSQRQQ